MKSLKKEAYQKTLFVIFLNIIVFGIISGIIFYQNRIKNIFDTLKIENSDVTNYIRAYFKKFYIEIEYLSRLKYVKYAFLDKEARKKTLKTFKIFKDIDKDITYIYSGYKNKMLIINNYFVPKNFDPTIRPWYIAALKSYPKISGGIPYKEYTTKEWIVSISKALVDNNNNIVGVVSIDTSLNKILKKLSEKNILKLSNLIIKDNGLIILDRNSLNLNKNFFKEYKINKNIFNKEKGFFEYKINNVKKLAYFYKIKDLGWIVITNIDKKSIIDSLFKNLAFILLIITIISIIIGLIFIQYIYKKIINSLHGLLFNIKEIINGNTNTIKKVHFPYIEFEEIRKNIESLTANALYAKNKELQRLNKQLKDMALKDKLTGLFNRYKLNEEINRAVEEYKRYNTPFCLIMFDIDFFKKINDTYGHDVGDRVLKTIADITKRICRKTDIPARWGGEEFMILCPHSTLDTGVKIAERLRKTVENYDFGIDRKVTISLGVTEYDNEKIKDLLKAVDEKLYQAKNSGRNKVIY